MNVNLLENLIKYYNLRILSFKEDIDVKKKWLKNIKKYIIHFLDTEMRFLDFYKILKSVEKEGFGFQVKSTRRERLSENEKEKISYQGIEICVKYIGYSRTDYVVDTGYEEVTSNDTLRIKTSENIKPEEIIYISNIEVLNAIKILDKKVYNHIVDVIIEELRSYIKNYDEHEMFVIKNIISEKILNEYGVSKCCYSFFKYSESSMCIEKEKEIWQVYYGFNGKKYCLKKYSHLIEACLEMLDNICDFDDKKFLKEQLILKLKTTH